MAPGILNKLRRRQSTSPHRPHSYVHHASTPPEWATSPAQITPDVYLTSPAEDDGLLTSVCVHRAIEHEPKRLRKEAKHDSSPPIAASSVLAAALASADEPGSPVSDSPPTFGRSSLQTSDVVMPKKPSEILRETTKWNPLTKDKADEPAEAKVQPDGSKQGLTRVSSGRDSSEGLNVPKSKITLRHRASKVLKSITSRDHADKRASQPDPRAKTPGQHKRRNTLSDSSEAAFGMLAQASTAHGLPRETSNGGEPGSPPPRNSGEGGRRRSSTLGHVEFTPRPCSPPRPPIPGGNVSVEDLSIRAPITVLEPAAEITISSPINPSFDSAKAEKPKKLQRRRSKNAFTHLFALKGEKMFRSPPPAKVAEDPVPPVPSIPDELAKAVADPDTPEASQSSTFASTPTATPKSAKSKRFGRHRRATIGSISQLPGDITGTPSSASTAQPETPKSLKTPTTPRTRTFTIVDLRKGFHVRGLGKSKGKLFSAKSNPEIRSPPPPAQGLSQASESRENLESTQKPRPPPLQSTESPQPNVGFAIAVNGETDGTADFVASLETTDVPSPIESTGPVTPVFGAPETPAPECSEQDQAKVSTSTEGVPDLSYTATTEEHEAGPTRPSEASEATLLLDDPLFTALSAPSTLGDLQLQLREPSTKTSTLDAHLRLESLRFDNFSFDAEGF